MELMDRKKGNKQLAEGPYLAIRIATRNQAFLPHNLISIPLLTAVSVRKAG